MANEQTRVHGIMVREKKELSAAQPPSESTAEWSEVAPKRHWFDWERFLRNTAVAGTVLLLVVAIRQSGGVNVQTVFSALQTDAAVEWDANLGKLTFVSNLLPESLRTVWNEQSAAEVYTPVSGQVVHVWSVDEPYIELQGTVRDVRAAQNGEVMSVAHGLDEERIVRIRHDDGLETIYGNMAVCDVSEGAYVYAGDLLGTVLEGKPLCFEVRRDGRPINPGTLREPETQWN